MWAARPSVTVRLHSSDCAVTQTKLNRCAFGLRRGGLTGSPDRSAYVCGLHMLCDLQPTGRGACSPIQVAWAVAQSAEAEALCGNQVFAGAGVQVMFPHCPEKQATGDERRDPTGLGSAVLCPPFTSCSHKSCHPREYNGLIAFSPTVTVTQGKSLVGWTPSP